MKVIVFSILRSYVRSRAIAFRTFPFVALILLLFAFAFDPDRGLVEKISPGLFWLAVLFGSTFIFTSQMENKNETKFFSSYGIDPVTLFFSRVIVNFIVVVALSIYSGILTVVLYSPPIQDIGKLVIVVLVTCLALSSVGAIYTPLVSRSKDSGQLLSLLIIPVLIPVFLGAIKATENIFQISVGEPWPWIGLIGIFSLVYISAGALAASSLYD
jgi:heme exporter protein B